MLILLLLLQLLLLLLLTTLLQILLLILLPLIPFLLFLVVLLLMLPVLLLPLIDTVSGRLNIVVVQGVHMCVQTPYISNGKSYYLIFALCNCIEVFSVKYSCLVVERHDVKYINLFIMHRLHDGHG